MMIEHIDENIRKYFQNDWKFFVFQNTKKKSNLNIAVA